MEGVLIFFNKYLIYFFGALLIVNAALALWVFGLRQTFRKIFRGESADLEKTLLDLRTRQDVSDKTSNALINRVKFLEEALPRDIRRVGIVRYNPFSDSGGDQSFVLALLNDHRNGVVITSLYGREINRVYAKPIENGKSRYALTAEETRAIEEAFSQ